MRAFVGGEVVPDATTLLKFRHLLERHDLPRPLFTESNALLAERGRFLMEVRMSPSGWESQSPAIRTRKHKTP